MTIFFNIAKKRESTACHRRGQRPKNKGGKARLGKPYMEQKNPRFGDYVNRCPLCKMKGFDKGILQGKKSATTRL